MTLSLLNLALINVGIFSIISLSTRYFFKSLKAINLISYWWLTFTILTGIWESYFIYFYDNVSCYSKELLFDNKHVWNTKYPINYLMPHKFSYIFYSEYAAYADREYMVLTNKWSRTIEGTHEVFCGVSFPLASSRDLVSTDASAKRRTKSSCTKPVAHQCSKRRPVTAREDALPLCGFDACLST